MNERILALFPYLYFIYLYIYSLYLHSECQSFAEKSTRVGWVPGPGGNNLRFTRVGWVPGPGGII